MPTQQLPKDIKVVPPASIVKPEPTFDNNKDPFKISLLGIFISYLILTIIITFLPLCLTLKILSLVIGSFLLFDILHSLKRRNNG